MRIRLFKRGLFILAFIGFAYYFIPKINWNPKYSVGDKIDEYNQVSVYYNGGVGHVSGRNLSADGYNLGLKWQCVEFVKRYYFERFQHKMPNSMGNAKDFFNPQLKEGDLNIERGLIQCRNGGQLKPQIDDLIIFDGYILNRFGHVAIVSDVKNEAIEIVQQNAGPFSPSREILKLNFHNNSWQVEHGRVLGWLRRVKN